MSLDSRDDNPEHASLRIDGGDFEVVSLRGEEALSRLFRFEIACACSAPLPVPGSLIGHRAEITLRSGHGSERRVTGIVAEAAVRAFEDGGGELTVTVRPAVYPLTLGRDCYVLQDADVLDVAKDVLAAHRGPVRHEITRTYPKRAYCAQYREDDWSFLSRLFEQEGIYYWFDHRGDETCLVLADRSTAAPAIEGASRIAFSRARGASAPVETVYDVTSEARAATGKFTIASFDPDRPDQKISATAGEGAAEVYVARGGGSPSPAVCAARAEVLREAAAAASRTWTGGTTSVRLVPGMIFELAGHPQERLDGKYLVTEVRYAIAQRRRGAGPSGGPAYECRFRAVRAETMYRAPAVTPQAMQAGLQTGVVVGTPGEEIYPDATGRVRVQHHWDRIGGRDHAAGKWMRVAQRGTEGSMLLPRIDWTVLTFNEEGAIDAPSVLSRIFDGEHLPPYALPANKTRVVFKTATTPRDGSSNEIRFEDTAGAEEMFIHASRDATLYVQNKREEHVFRDQRRKVGEDRTARIGGRCSEIVGRNQSVDVGGDETVAAEQSRVKAVSADETITIGGDRALETGATQQTTVEQNRLLKVGLALLDTTLGPVKAAVAKKQLVMVGGATVKATFQNMTEEVRLGSAQAIGWLKLERAKTDRTLEVKGIHKEVVGGDMLLEAAKDCNDHAEESSSIAVAGALSGEAPEIEIVATDRIVVRCGGSALVVTPESVEIIAPSFLSAAPGVSTADLVIV